MIFKEDTYCTVPHKIVREIGAFEAIVFATIAGLLRKSDGIGEVSNQTLMEMCGINNKMSLFRYIGKIIQAGYIEKRSGDGRGNISIYYITEKGNNLLPFNNKKGNKNDIKRVTILNEKGNNLLPIYKDNNKDNNKGGEYARYAHMSPSPTPIKIEDNLFLYFWSIYPYANSYPHEQEECYKYWQQKSEIEKDSIIAGIEQKKFKSLKNPIFFLREFRLTIPNKNTKVRSAIVNRFLDVIIADTNQDICEAIANIKIQNDTMYICLKGNSQDDVMPIINQIEKKMLDNVQRVRDLMERNNFHKIEYRWEKTCE